MRLFLGVDGGQSRTVALIGDETGLVLGGGSAGPCNHVGASEGRQKLTRAVADSVGKACQAAGVEFAAARFEAACFGMSGGPEDKQAILAEILPASRLLVTTDAAVALAGATAGAPGVVVIAGTGSIALGRNAQGQTARAGGWGYVFGDEGGAFDIVRQALRAALRMEEEWGPPTALGAALLQAAGAASVSHALHLFYTSEWPRPRLAALAPLVDLAAEEGDAAARQILNAAAQELALLAAAVLGRLWKPGDPVTVAYAGGVFESRTVLGRFRLLVELRAGIRCVPPLHGPAAGALLEAYRGVGLAPELRNVPDL